MATTIELERTYLLKYLPEGIDQATSVIIHDIYIPEQAPHAHLRLRHSGEKYEITKKMPVENDPSKQYEHTIELEEEEFEALAKSSSKDIKKRRYYMTVEGHKAEIDVYLDKLEGLAVIDFEFDSEDLMNSFKVPDFAAAEVTKEEAIAAGFLAGKSYRDIQSRLKDYNYSKFEQGVKS